MTFLEISSNLNITNAPKESKVMVLQMTGCTISLEDDFPMSEFEETSFYLLNTNDGFGRIDIEVRFENSPEITYKDYLIRTVAIRNERSVMFKKTKGVEKRNKCRSKVTKEGESAIGISCYFSSNEHREDFLNSEKILIEFCVAFRKRFGYFLGVYDVCCSFKKVNNEWVLEKANTYRNHKFSSIKSLVH